MTRSETCVLGGFRLLTTCLYIKDKLLLDFVLFEFTPLFITVGRNTVSMSGISAGDVNLLVQWKLRYLVYLCLKEKICRQRSVSRFKDGFASNFCFNIRHEYVPKGNGHLYSHRRTMNLKVALSTEFGKNFLWESIV